MSSTADATLTATRQGQYLLLEVELPGRAPVSAGVLLFDPTADRLALRLRPRWDDIAGPEDVEVLELLGAELRSRVAEWGAEATLRFLEDTLSNTLRISDRRTVLLGNFDATLVRLYNKHVSTRVEPFVTHLPLYSLKAAAGRFGESAFVEEEGWMEAPPGLRLREGMFVAQVTGRSMEPRIPDGSYCIFRHPVVGSRQGKLVLVENRDESEAAGQRYTIKRYRSAKRSQSSGEWEHERIWLEPLNPEFEAWDLEEGSRIAVLAEFIQVLE